MVVLQLAHVYDCIPCAWLFLVFPATSKWRTSERRHPHDRKLERGWRETDSALVEWDQNRPSSGTMGVRQTKPWYKKCELESFICCMVNKNSVLVLCEPHRLSPGTMWTRLTQFWYNVSQTDSVLIQPESNRLSPLVQCEPDRLSSGTMWTRQSQS